MPQAEANAKAAHGDADGRASGRVDPGRAACVARRGGGFARDAAMAISRGRGSGTRGRAADRGRGRAARPSASRARLAAPRGRAETRRWTAGERETSLDPDVR